VLAGVSRTGKTPTSIYLAQLGFRVANVALAIEVASAVRIAYAARQEGGRADYQAQINW